VGRTIPHMEALQGGPRLKLELIAHTENPELIAASAILTTCTGKNPARLVEELRRRPGKVERLLAGIPLTHGSVLEHNRLVWLVEADESEILRLILRHRFFEATQLREGLWLLSANLRTVVEFILEGGGWLRGALLESIRGVAPTIWRRLRGGG